MLNGSRYSMPSRIGRTKYVYNRNCLFLCCLCLINDDWSVAYTGLRKRCAMMHTTLHDAEGDAESDAHNAGGTRRTQRVTHWDAEMDARDAEHDARDAEHDASDAECDASDAASDARDAASDARNAGSGASAARCDASDADYDVSSDAKRTAKDAKSERSDAAVAAHGAMLFIKLQQCHLIQVMVSVP